MSAFGVIFAYRRDHKITYPPLGEMPSQQSQGAALGYLIWTGIEPGVMILGLTTSPDVIYVLVESALAASPLATEVSA